MRNSSNKLDGKEKSFFYVRRVVLMVRIVVVSCGRRVASPSARQRNCVPSGVPAALRVPHDCVEFLLFAGRCVSKGLDLITLTRGDDAIPSGVSTLLTAGTAITAIAALGCRDEYAVSSFPIVTLHSRVARWYCGETRSQLSAHRVDTARLSTLFVCVCVCVCLQATSGYYVPCACVAI